MATRINKYLSEVGYCSRRGADRLIAEGKVTINGEFPKIGTKVKEGDHVEVEGYPARHVMNFSGDGHDGWLLKSVFQNKCCFCHPPKTQKNKII